MQTTTLTHEHNLFSDAWQHVHGFKGTFWLAVLYGLAIFILVAAITSPIHFLGMKTGIVKPTSFLISILTTYFTLPIGLGILMLALRHIANSPMKASHVFVYYRLPIMAQLFLLTAFFVTLNIALFLIPSMSMRIALIFIEMILFPTGVFSAMLIGDQGMTFFPALGRSLKAVIRRYFKIVGLCISLVILFLIGLLTLGIGFIWIAPLMVNLLAVFYQYYVMVNTIREHR